MRKYTSQLAAITKAAFQNISEKDIKAFDGSGAILLNNKSLQLTNTYCHAGNS